MTNNGYYSSYNDFAKKIKFSNKMLDVIMNFNNYPFTFLEGAAQTGKSVTAALCFAFLIENAPKEDKVFMGLGYTEGSAKNNIQNYLLWYFTTSKCRINCKYNNMDCCKIKTKTGEKIVVFTGGSTVSANNSWHGWPISGFLIDEIDRIHQNSINEVIQRQTTFPNARIICTMNPNMEKHPIYKQLDYWIKEKMCYYKHFSITDNPILTPERIRQVEKMYRPGSLAHKRYFLGQRVNGEEAVFTVEDYNRLKEFNSKDYINYIIVADPGETLSATVFICLAYRYEEDTGKYCIDVIKEYYHKNDKTTGKDFKLPTEYASDLIRFIKECVDIMKFYPDALVIDEGEVFIKYTTEASYKEHINLPTIYYPEKPNDSERIKFISSILHNGQLNFYTKCEHSIEDIESSTLDSKLAKVGKIKLNDGFNEQGHSDARDAVIYGAYYYYDKL